MHTIIHRKTVNHCIKASNAKTYATEMTRCTDSHDTKVLIKAQYPAQKRGQLHIIKKLCKYTNSAY
jgi:hypothetical protein